MADIQIFNNPSFGEIRTVMNENNEPLFCASDVCKALGYANGRDAIAKHVSEDDVAKCDIIDSLGRTQSASFVNESGLYSLIFGSKLESAKAFKRWVTSEVLPSIRKTGSYATPQSMLQEKIMAAKFVAEFLNLNEVSKLLLAKSITEPLGLPTPDYVPSKGMMHSAKELLKLHGIQMSVQALNKALAKVGILKRETRNGRSGTHKWYVITDSGSRFGENHVCPQNPKQTQPLWYDNLFSELVSVATR